MLNLRTAAVTSIEPYSLRRLDEKTCCVTVTVQDSPVFRGWLARFGDLVSIV